MNRLFYPAVFHKAEEGGFWVSFPDLPECMTQGDSMDEAYEMAVDALGLSLSSMEDEGAAFPHRKDENKYYEAGLVYISSDKDHCQRIGKDQADHCADKCKQKCKPQSL